MSTQQDIRFDLGKIVATPGALEALRRNNNNGLEYIQRHSTGDWGMLCEEDREANNEALQDGSRLLSAYFLPDETKLWIITEAQREDGSRQCTTLLLPEEY